MSEWQPSPEEIHLGQESYIRYLGGVAILNAPHHQVSEALLASVAEEDVEAAILRAEDLLYNGLRGVIKYANSPVARHWAQAEHGFGAALPHMIEIVDGTYERHARRLDRINPAFNALRPAPMYDETTYHSLCHANRGRLYTERLMDGVQSAAIFRPKLAGRRLTIPSAS